MGAGRHSAPIGATWASLRNDASSSNLSIFHGFRVVNGFPGVAQRAQSVYAVSDQRGYGEELSRGNAGHHPKVSDGRQTHAGEAAALRTVRSAAELTWRDPRLQVRRNGERGAGKDAIFRRRRRVTELVNRAFVHVDQGIQNPQP